MGPRGRHMESASKGRKQADRPDKKPVDWRVVWPDIKALVYPRRWQLVGGFLLIVVSRSAGLVLPASTKYLVDDVLGRKMYGYLGPLAAIVLVATLVQSASSFWLTQILSKSAQRLIADLRCRVQAH